MAPHEGRPGDEVEVPRPLDAEDSQSVRPEGESVAGAADAGSPAMARLPAPSWGRERVPLGRACLAD